MLPRNLGHAAFAAVLLLIGGCSAAWIQNPSSTTRNLVDDLKLEGYVCKAHWSTIECRQEKPYEKKAPMVCTSAAGCVPQPGELVTNVYSISQDDYGIPAVQQWVESQPNLKLKGYVCEQGWSKVECRPEKPSNKDAPQG
ncbi:TPA: hypothetical protein ACP32N_005125 [Pseudomonas aeruginosa]